MVEKPDFKNTRLFVQALGFRNKEEYQAWTKKYNAATPDEQVRLVFEQFDKSEAYLTPAQIKARVILGLQMARELKSAPSA